MCINRRKGWTEILQNVRVIISEEARSQVLHYYVLEHFLYFPVQKV